jgi:putative MFS transporter
MQWKGTMMSQSSTSRATPSGAARLTIEATIDTMSKVGLSRGAWVALMLSFFFANYDISVFALTLPAMRDQLGLQGADLAWPVAANLAGYAVGAYIIGQISDRKGRQVGLFLTFALLGVGGILTAFSWDTASLSVFRLLTGGGMGAVLSLCAAYIGEMAPRDRRGRYLATLYLFAGVITGITAFASLPVLTAFPVSGWRYLLAFGGLVLLILPLVNKRSLMESPRWLLAQGRAQEATDVVRRMQRVAGDTVVDDGTLIEAAAEIEHDAGAVRPLAALLRRPLVGRLLTVLGFWFIFYVAMYAFSSYLPLILEITGVETSTALFITALSRSVPVLIGIPVIFLIERIERRTIIIAGAILFAVGILLVVFGLGEGAATLGAILATCGITVVATPAYTYTAEVFPTKVRGTAASICDGLGHLGGALAPFVILPILLGPGALAAGVTMVALLVASAGIIRLGPRTRNRTLLEIADSAS